MIINFKNAVRKHSSNVIDNETENSVQITLTICIDKPYYRQIMQICENMQLDFGGFLNEAVGEYVAMNSYDHDAEQQRLEKLFATSKPRRKP